LNGSLDFYKGFDFSKGTGSFFGGLQTGYNYMFPSQVVLGVEDDVSFPNSIRGTQTTNSASIGQASYGEMVEYSGTVRGRVGHSFNNWLIYGTTGFAWTRDQFTRAQLAGTPLGGTAVAGTTESALRWRTGWAVGAGVEVPIAPNWTGKFEYLFTDFATTSVKFPAAVQRFDSDLTLHELRLGLNYRFGNDTGRANSLTTDRLSIHGQSTYVNQYAPGFREPYRGPNSLISKSGRETWDATLYVGLRLWQGAEVWINPEIDQGFGLSKTLGVAESDLSIRLWPALTKDNGIKAAGVKLYKISAAVREPILSAGQVDAVAGFSYLSAVNLRDRGVPADDLAVLRYADYGCEAYGFALIVNPAFAAAKPEAVRGFVRAVIAGTHLSIKDPARAVDDVVNRMNGGLRDLELDRLRTVISDNILTAEVKRDGLGSVDPARLERAIDQIAEEHKFRKRPVAADVFDDGFLPPVGGRLIN